MPTLSGDASQAKETAYDVFPVERRLNGFVGAFLSGDVASEAEPVGAIAEASGLMLSPPAPATKRIDPARAHETACRSADMRRLRDNQVLVSRPPSDSIRRRAARFPSLDWRSRLVSISAYRAKSP